MNEQAIFIAALQAEPGVRSNYLEKACGGDETLRRRVEKLLAAHERAGSFLAEPAIGRPALDENATGEFIPDAPDAAYERVGTVIGGRYKLIEVIGEGGMGVVYMAQQTTPVKRAVAVKVIKAGMDSKAVLARFEAERQAVAMMDHPNIARVLDAGTTDSSRPYFVMELVKGVAITQFCDERKLAPRQRLELFVQVCHAIQHAHQKGVIHRDIKPSNVLVAMYDDRPVPKVIDFGVAKATAQILTEKTLMTGFGALAGTPEYMSPEQASLNNLDIDTRSDVYSLGVLLYELLTGTTPVDRKSLGQAAMLEVLRIVREVDAPRPSAKLSSSEALPSIAAHRNIEPARLTRYVHGELDWVLLKALEKERTRRYESANALGRDIQRFLADEVVEAQPPSAGYRLSKFIRRHKPQVTAAALVFLALLAGIGGTTFGLIRADQRRRDAEQARNDESLQRRQVVEEQGKTQGALDMSLKSEAKAVAAEREALRQAANAGCDTAQQLCERNSVAQGLSEYGRALKFAHAARDAELEEVIRWNIAAWLYQMYAPAYAIATPRSRYVATAAFDPTGKMLAVGGKSLAKGGVTVQLYDAADGSPQGEPLRIDGPKRIYRLAWTSDGTRLAVYTGDGWAHILRPGQTMPTLSFEVDANAVELGKHQCPHLAFSPDGARLIVGRINATAAIFDVASGKLASVQLDKMPRTRSDGSEMCVDWSRDGSRIASGDSFGMARIWDAKTGHLLREIQACRCGIEALHFNADGRQIVCASGTGMPELRVWDANTGAPVGPAIVHLNNYYDANFSPDGKLIVAADVSCECIVQEVGGARTVGAPIWTGCSATLSSFHPDGRRLLTVVENEIRVWTLATEMKRADIALDDPEEARLAPYSAKFQTWVPDLEKVESRVIFRNLALSRDGNCLIKYEFGKHGDGMEMIDARTFKTIRKVPCDSSVRAVYWRSDGREFVATTNAFAAVYDAGTGSIKARFGSAEGSSGSFRPDGARFAIGTHDYNLVVFDTQTWKPVGPVLPHTAFVCDSTYSQDGKIIFTADSVRTTRLWHAATGKRIGPVIPGQWPRVSTDNESFIVVDRHRRQAYRIPSPILGAIDDIMHRLEVLTNRRDTGFQALEDDAPPQAPIGPAVALQAIDKTITLKMQVKSANFSGKKKWIFLNSEDDSKSPRNFSIAVAYQSDDRLKSMGLDPDVRNLKGIWVNVTGQVSLHHNVPTLFVLDPGQLRIIVGKDAATGSIR